MFLWRICRKESHLWGLLYNRYISTHEKSLKSLCKHFNISESEGKYLHLKHPTLQKLDEDKIKNLINTLYELGFSRNSILKEPSVCGLLPVTLKFRYSVLQECGIDNIKLSQLISYLTITKQQTIGELKKSGIICNSINVENKLASYLTQWPTSLTTLVYGDVNNFSLYSLRLKIIQRYLELILDLSQDEFFRGLQTYPTIKHRPLRAINETLNILRGQILMPIDKIKTNLYLVHSDPENLKNILSDFRSIGGIDIREVLRRHPKIAIKNCSTLKEIRNILNEYGVSNEAQIRCFQIFTLSPTTIRERLEKAKTIPEFNTFYNHPRFLKLIHYNATAMKRIMKLYKNNKRCLSLNILSSSAAHYEVFEKAPGDRMGKGKDLVFCVSQLLGRGYSMSNVRSIMKRHPFWFNVPVIRVKYVYEQLSTNFSSKDIYENCPILLYPWNKIKETLNIFNKKQNCTPMLMFHENLDLSILSNSQRLSLILYILEKNHYFTGNGVWTEEKYKNSVELSKPVESSQMEFIYKNA